MQAEERVLQDARVAFFQGNYPDTILLLDRFLTNHPGSRLLDEARWWLARAQQQHGDLREALVRYRQLAQSRHPNSYRDEARLRVAEMESLLGVHHDMREFSGVVVGVQALLQPNGLDVVADYRNQVSARAVVVDLPCRTPFAGEVPGNSSLPGAKLWDRIIVDGIKPLVSLGKELGFGVMVAVPLRCMGAFYEASAGQTRRWRDHTYDVNRRKIEQSEAYSLFSAEYRDVVFSLLSQVAELRVMGLLFRASASQGPYEGFTPLAVRAFEQQFGEPVMPELFFETRSGGEAMPSSHLINQSASVSFDYPPLFWKWAGWKAREGFRLMNELAVHLRSQFPFLKIGLEIHPESVINPLSALVNVGQDWIEMSHGEFDVMVTNPQNLPNLYLQTGMSDHNGRDSTARSNSLVRQMAEYLGNTERVWVIQSKGHYASLHNQGVPMDSDLPKGVGILYDYTSIP